MKINLTKKQYRELIRLINISDYIIGPMSDFVSDDYKKEAKEIEELQSYLLQYAKDFECEDLVSVCCGELYTSDDFSEELHDTVISDYDDYNLFDRLSNKLAWRDFRNRYTEEEIKEMSEKSHGYLGVPLYPFEKKYYDEFNKNEYNNLFLVDNSDKKLFDWNFLKSKLRKNKRRVFTNERDIRWCFIGENIGYEVKGSGVEFSRPVVVLKRISLNTSLIVPLTKSNKRPNSFSLGNFNSDFESFALLDQIRLVDNRRFKNKIGVLDKGLFEELVVAIKKVNF